MTTPMMRQYYKLKEQYPDAILFFRLGDFYEMFGEDAKVASRILEITLTTRDANKENPVPMCGVPYHSVNSYLGKLLNHGYKVAICEQVEDPSKAKGIVKRAVVRVVTPGTIADKELLAEQQNNFLCAVCQVQGTWGLAFVDVSTGEFNVTELSTTSKAKVVDEINRFSARECLLSVAEMPADLVELVRNTCLVTNYPEQQWSIFRAYRKLEKFFGKSNLESFGIMDCNAAVMAASVLVSYLEETQKQTLKHVNQIHTYSAADFMLLDGATRRNLELLETMRSKEKRGSLLWVLDRTVTALGARLLKKIILQPLLQKREIERRQEAVAEFVSNVFVRQELRELLKQVYDLERLTSKLVYQSANARDLLALGQSLAVLPRLKEQLFGMQSPLLRECYRQLDTLEDIAALIRNAIKEQPPVSVTDGGIIKEGFDTEIDRLREAAVSGKKWLAKLEQEEKEKTGIKSLKIKYNKVFGYYLEVTKANLDLVPDYYQRKQTLANAERFITPRLKELEDTILGAEEKQVKLEYEVFCKVRDTICNETPRIQAAAKIIALIDVLLSLAVVAEENNYTRPDVIEGEEVLEIEDGRHPVLEKLTEIGDFVANDIRLGGETELMVITGPNMAGKSTYMRQVALIVLMAQMGSFVPARAARIPLVDRIFTRVGAADDLSTGQSTFMVEMNEVANILHNATKRSLIILDEIGRGTSTYDGMAIAWAVIEYLITQKSGAKTLFATHYHQLTRLEDLYPKVKNFHVAVEEQGEKIVFLRKIISGGTDKSYGIQVARLAGLPRQVILRAREILEEIETNESGVAVEVAAARQEQLALFETSDRYAPIIKEIKQLDLSNTTPLQALNKLAELQQRVKEEEGV
ncbi:MAG: DNA mismatch repair protein MutS [Thermoanaerobacteraceae bacterium]|nr:DNA mismatch repair protein MutS [Thermoanaerobacteraceae bacterium]